MLSTCALHSFWLGSPAAGTSADSGHHSHRWTVYVRGLQDDDLSYIIASVTFGLHSSFAEPTRVCVQPPYEVTETGWGEFAIAITIAFRHPSLPPVHMQHLLRLFPPPTQQPSTARPVMSEQYDELVFDSPSRDVYALVRSGPTQRFASHPFSAWWTTEDVARQESEQLHMLVAVSEKVQERLRRERHRLWKAEHGVRG